MIGGATRARRRTSLDGIVEATPPDRDRYVDFLRAISILVIVVGHWLITVSTYSHGKFTNSNLVAMVPNLWITTWVLQVVPIFFFVGGFSNGVTLAAIERRGGGYVEFVVGRLRRLLRPVLVLLAVWIPIALVLDLNGTSHSVLYPATRLVTQLLWFIAVYLIVIAFASPMYRLHRRIGLGAIICLACLAIAGDVARFRIDSSLGIANVAVVWLCVHQIGFFYADGRLPALGRPRLWLIAVTGVAMLALLTGFGPYPSSLVGLPKARVSNMSPPTICQLALAIWQISLAMLARDRVNRWLQRATVWRRVISLNAVIMTMFCWHLTSQLITVFVLNALGLPQYSAGTISWWLIRPIWFASLALFLAILVAVFGGLERPKPQRRDRGLETPARTFLIMASLFFITAGVVGFSSTALIFEPLGEHFLDWDGLNPIQSTLRLGAGLGFLWLASAHTKAPLRR